MGRISLRKVNKIYKGGIHAVRDMSFDIDDGEFTVLVGPSGCGKSTLLRMIAGLEEITFGELFIDDVLANALSPKERGVAMVFQNYALFPHMTVFDNIAFGLKMKKVARAEIKKSVEEAADILGVTSLLSRKPAQLSGGQKQRVALGRALVNKPRIFLLDEPLSNLDAKLRASMRSELIKLHRRLGTTFVYVTHDQTEALTMGAKIVVLKDGVLQQADNPRRIYAYPRNKFTAAFIGSPLMNMFGATLENADKPTVKTDCAEYELPPSVARAIADFKRFGSTVTLGIRPESVRISDAGKIAATVLFYEPLGGSGIVGLDVGDVTVNVITDGKTAYAEGEKVRLEPDAEQIRLFDEQSGESLLAAPQYNYLRARATADNGAIKVEFAGTQAVLDKYDCLTDDGALQAEALFALSSRACADGDIAVDVSVKHVSEQFGTNVVYGETVATGERVIFECANDQNYRAGEVYAVRFACADCTLCGADGNRILSAYPSRGRWRALYEKGDKARAETLTVLADEKFNDGWLLYCGADDDYCVVKAPSDFPVYGKSKIKVAPAVD